MNPSELYEQASAEFSAAIQRLARGYEADAELRRDLVQEIHIALWRSFRVFDERCSLRTWVYRVAHNTSASHILRNRRASSWLLELDEIDWPSIDGERMANRRLLVAALLERIERLKPLDRQIMLLYLEGEAAASIAEVTGISATNVATKIHRIKKLLGGTDA